MNVNILILDFLKDNKPYMIFYLIFIISYPISSVLLPQYYSKVIDDIKNNKNPAFKKLLLFFLISNSMFLALDKIDTVFIPKLQSFIRKNIVKSVLNTYKNNFEEQDLGIAISQIVKFPLVVKDLARQYRNYIIPLIFIMIGVLIKFYNINKKIAILFLSLLLISTGILYPFYIKVKNLSINLDKDTDSIHENISEMFDNLMDIYSMNMIDKELDELEKYQKELIERYKTTFNKTNNLRALIQILSVFIFMSCMFLSYKMMKNNEIPHEDVITIFIMSMFVIKKIGGFAGELPDFIFNIGIYNKISENLSKLKENKKDQNIKENFLIKEGSISFENISIIYDKKEILKNFSLNIKPRESIIILGKIGSGKSSLIKSLLKLIKFNGNIYIDGVNTKNISITDIRSGILYIRQNPLPFNRTFYENVMYGIENITKTDVDKIFLKLNLKTFFDKDLNAKVGRKGNNLSGGQRMIMFLLRILIHDNKKIIILDEPTSSLDDDTSIIIMNIIKDIVKNQTTIIITHDTRLSNIVDRIIKL